MAALGCANAAEDPAAPPARPEVPLARFEVTSPPPKETAELLEQVLRVEAASESIDVEDEERRLRRLRGDTLDVLATEGYFTPGLTISPDDTGAARYTLQLDLGRRTRIAEVTIEFAGALAGQTERADELRASWELRVGEPFREARWSAAKTRLLNRVRARDFAAARLADAVALVDSEQASAQLFVQIDSGPEYTLGPLEVRGLVRYERGLIDRYNPVEPGERYDADKLLEFQRRLQRSPYFGTVIVDVDPAKAEGTVLPVLVEVREAQTKRASFALGVSSDVGVRGEAAYRQANLFGHPYSLQSGVSLDRTRQSAYADIYLPMRPGGVQDSVGALLEFTDSEGTATDRWALGAQRTFRRDHGSMSYDHQINLSVQHESRTVEGAPEQDVVNDTFAATYAWTWRAVDSLTNPTKGTVITLSGTGGIGRSSVSNFLQTGFVRGYARINYYLPLSPRDQLLLRGQAGHVAVDDPRVVPNEFLFRTGGVGSVRGYAFQSLGASEGTSVTGSTTLLVLSAEYVRWLTEQWGAAVFVDAGDASNDLFSQPLARGYGLGARYRTLAGPLAVDVAWADRTGGVRVAFNVSIAF